MSADNTFLVATMTDVAAVFMFSTKVVVIENDGTVTEIKRTSIVPPGS